MILWIALGALALLVFGFGTVFASTGPSEATGAMGDPTAGTGGDTTTSPDTSSAPPPPKPLFTGAAAELPDWQQAVILDAAAANGNIDPRLLAAIAIAENGPQLDDGTRGYGVLDRAARKDNRTNAGWAADAIRRTLGRYRANIGQDPIGPDGRATPQFLRYLAYGGKGYSGYAQLGVTNDPTNLNANWLTNVLSTYQSTALA